jgi:quercetin dioxygenase-like cupin family protein
MFRELNIKGIPRYLIDERLEGEPIHMHISEVGPGGRSHPPHQHGGYEAFYILDGVATFEIDDERITLRAGETAVFDPQRMHGLLNEGEVPIRYIVVLRP